MGVTSRRDSESEHVGEVVVELDEGGVSGVVGVVAEEVVAGLAFVGCYGWGRQRRRMHIHEGRYRTCADRGSVRGWWRG
jgi:hypothetical protein